MTWRNNWFILTGGPGSGKTSVLDHLSETGHIVVPEVARKIIQEQMAQQGTTFNNQSKG
jgi:predicted ATPase